MSHVVEIKTEVKDAAAVRSACQRLKLEPPSHGTARLFSGEATGLIVKLPNWQYPVVFNTSNGEAKYDRQRFHHHQQHTNRDDLAVA